MAFLNERFKKCDTEGIYCAHQPIYGFRMGHCEQGTIFRYIVTYQIVKALSHINFSSLLDVGGAEGYKAALVRYIFNKSVKSVDISHEACKRAKEIFNIDGTSIDIHNLPFKDNEFDVVLCSETLEHVADIHRATKELIRVSKKAVIITVPHEPMSVVENNIKNNVLHGHIHSLDTNSFNFTIPLVTKIITRKFHNNFMKILCEIADAETIYQTDYPQHILKAYNLSIPILRLIFRKKIIRSIIKIDDYVSNKLSSYGGMIFILLKDASCYSNHQITSFSMQQIINFNVPYHVIKK